MEKITCCCAKCNACFGNFLNQWIKIGKSYVSPIIDIDEIASVTLRGVARLGDKKTLVENCHLQDLACKCNAVIGLKCLDTPVNHVLRDGQLFLRSSSVKFKNLHTHEPAEIKIQRSLKLREIPQSGSTAASTSSSPESNANMSTDHDRPSEIHGHLLDHLQAQLDAQREETQRLNRAGFQMASSFDNAVLRVEGEIQKLKDGMVDLKEEQRSSLSKIETMDDAVTQLRIVVNDLKNPSQNKSAYTHLDEELTSAKQAIADVQSSLSSELEKSAKRQQRNHETLNSGLRSARLDLATLQDGLDGTKKAIDKRVSAENAHTLEIAELRAEVKELREELAKVRSQKSPPREPAFPSREIDILTTNITKVGQRANQIEALQMEFELLRERVQRIDKGLTPKNQDTSTPGSQENHSIVLLTEASGRKRKLSPRPERTANLPVPPITLSSKRPTRRLRHSSPPSNHDSLFSSPPAKVQASDAQTPNSPRLTKSGAVDKRSMRRLTRLAASRNVASND